MSKEKQIIQLRQQGFSQRRIAEALKVSRNTVAKVFTAMEEHTDFNESLDSLNEDEIHRKSFSARGPYSYSCKGLHQVGYSRQFIM